ncbi:MAG: hypothetical protein EXS36_16420 [Pedosphaera sp.]|nr:hypothetical protein [Pedosphaera sp.]
MDYDFWVRLPYRQYVRLLSIVRRLGGTIRARTLYELNDGTQVNAIFHPDGLRSFETEWKRCRWPPGECVRARPALVARDREQTRRQPRKGLGALATGAARTRSCLLSGETLVFT